MTSQVIDSLAFPTYGAGPCPPYHQERTTDDRIRHRQHPIHNNRTRDRGIPRAHRATLAPYGGRFLIHGDPADVREGEFTGDLIAIEFPDRDRAEGWYASAAYRDIKPLRTRNSEGWVILIDGVPREHRAIDILTGSRTLPPG